MHTPGPWRVDHNPYDDEYRVYAERRVEPIINSLFHKGETQLDNARLIAAAPDLLEALQAAVARVELANTEGNPILSAWLPEARAAIAKATQP